MKRTDGWIPKGGGIRVGGRDIGGMVYAGETPGSSEFDGEDNAFIDISQSVSEFGGDYEGQGLHYWPNYSTIGERSRATYLDWLSSGRADTRFSVGYVFLYFYGLERRVFLDRANSAERNEIVAEVRRLLEIYGHNESIRNYLGTFVDAASLLSSRGDEFEPIYEQNRYHLQRKTLFALGRMVAMGQPLTADWLLSWYIWHPQTKLRSPARRVFPEFKALFGYLFDQKHPDGLKVYAPERRLKFNYYAASGNFIIDVIENQDHVPDVSGLSIPVSIAHELAEEAAAGLDRYSRYIGRYPEKRGGFKAHVRLPEAISYLFPCLKKEELRDWAASRIETGGLVPVEEVIEKIEGVRPEEIGKRQLTGISDTLAQVDIGVAPNPRYALRQPRYGEPVALFQLPKSAAELENPNDAYLIGLVKLVIGTLAAMTDGHIDASKKTHLVKMIEVEASLSDTERTSLQANLKWLIAVGPDLKMIQSRLKGIPESMRCELGRVAVAAAALNNTIGAEDIQAIEQLYAAIGLERDRVYTDLHAFTSAPGPVAVRRADNIPREFAIPPPPKSTAALSIALDDARVMNLMEETERVSRVLSDIFSDDEDGAGDVSDDRMPDTGNRFDGLDASHEAVVRVLITRPHWTEEEIAALADEHQLMAAGALETINDWAFEGFGDALVEEYNGYEVNGEFARQLMH